MKVWGGSRNRGTSGENPGAKRLRAQIMSKVNLLQSGKSNETSGGLTAMSRTFRAFLYIVSLIVCGQTQVSTATSPAAAWDLSKEFHSSAGKTLTIDLRSGGDVII